MERRASRLRVRGFWIPITVWLSVQSHCRGFATFIQDVELIDFEFVIRWSSLHTKKGYLRISVHW